MLTSGEVQSLRLEQALSFDDLCDFYTYSGNTTGTDGQLSPYYLTGTNQDCGFQYVRSGKIYRGQISYPEYDAELRTPRTLLIDVRSLFVVEGSTFTIDGLKVGKTANMYLLKIRDI